MTNVAMRNLLGGKLDSAAPVRTVHLSGCCSLSLVLHSLDTVPSLALFPVAVQAFTPTSADGFVLLGATAFSVWPLLCERRTRVYQAPLTVSSLSTDGGPHPPASPRNA